MPPPCPPRPTDRASRNDGRRIATGKGVAYDFGMRRIFPRILWLGLLGLLSGAPVIAGDLTEAMRLYSARQLAESRKALEGLTNSAGVSAEAHYWLGRIALEQQRAPDGVTALEQAVALASTNSLFREWLGRGYGTLAVEANLFKRPGYAKKTLASFLTAVELDGSNVPAREMLIAYYSGAPGFMGGSATKAMEQVEAIKKLDPVAGAAVHARQYAQDGDRIQAEKILRQAVAVHPSNAVARVHLGTWLLNEGKFPEAWKELREARVLSPTNGPAQFYLARTALRMGEHFREGEEALREYLKVQPPYGNPTPATAHYLLGLLLEKLKRPEDAQAEFVRASSLEPGNRLYTSRIRGK